MTSRQVMALSFFCEPKELNSILQVVLSTTQTRLCRAEKREDRWAFHEVEASEAGKYVAPQFYCCSTEMLARGSVDSLANFVQIWFPVRVESDLRMGEIGMLISNSGLDAGDRELQREIYRSIRKDLGGRLKKGVWGRNSKTGGEHFYKNIWISKEVEDAARKGLVLRPLLGDGFVTFSPDRAQ